MRSALFVLTAFSELHDECFCRSPKCDGYISLSIVVQISVSRWEKWR